MVLHNSLAKSSIRINIFFQLCNTRCHTNRFCLICSRSRIIKCFEKRTIPCWNRESILLDMFTTNLFIRMNCLILSWSCIRWFLWQVIKLSWAYNIIKRFSWCSKRSKITNWFHLFCRTINSIVFDIIR
jgi:hypothetical protein